MEVILIPLLKNISPQKIVYSDNVADDEECIINSSQQTVKQIEVNLEVVYRKYHSVIKNHRDLMQFSLEEKTQQKHSRKRKTDLSKNWIYHCFCCCHPTISYRLVDHLIKQSTHKFYKKIFHLFENVNHGQC